MGEHDYRSAFARWTDSRSFDIGVGFAIGAAAVAVVYFGWLALNYFLWGH
jgi:hypothetical protein